jgi:hypothetical protein
MERRLIVVSRNRPELWQELRRNYAPAEGTEVILDRRQWQRWTRPGADGACRPPAPLDMELQSQGFVVIPRPQADP